MIVQNWLSLIDKSNKDSKHTCTDIDFKLFYFIHSNQIFWYKRNILYTINLVLFFFLFFLWKKIIHLQYFLEKRILEMCYSKHHDLQYLDIFQILVFFKISLQTYTCNITWTSKSFLKKKAPLVFSIVSRKFKMKLISSRDNAWTPCRKMMYMTTWPIYELVIVTRYVSCYMYPETTLSLNKKEKLHGSWFPYWLITTYDVILPNLCIFRWCWLAQNILSYLEFKTTFCALYLYINSFYYTLHKGSSNFWRLC